MKNGRRDRREIVAAVCHRRRGHALEFLVVRTKGGTYWTFPKGHVELGESPADAALREAREEAGVEGEIAPAPFTRYRYPSTRRDEGESLVSAFLLAVVRQGSPAAKERRRDPTWLAPKDATRRLTARRGDDVYAEEHARVVREAVAALRG